MISSDAEKAYFRQQYKREDVRTWPFFPIFMPLKDGFGPAPLDDCDEITWEVWDFVCDMYESYDNLSDAINEAMRLTAEYFGEEGKDE